MYNNHLNESSIYDTTYSNEDLIEKLDEVDIFDEKKKTIIKMKPGELIKVCSDALYKMQRDYPYLYQFIAKCKVMYIPTYPSKITNTMAVDENNNLWINFHYVYNTCKMMSDRAFGILFHEMFHIFFDHCIRMNNKYPKHMFVGMPVGAFEKANMKANICMDYEVNASMVDDNIVTPDFFKYMNGIYKKEYTGMTWEEILDRFGDKEYKDWLSRNGMSLDDVEMKVLEAIEKASKVLLDDNAEEDEKRAARRELKKKLDELLGVSDKGEKSLQDVLEDLQNSKLGDIGDLAYDIDNVIDDLHKSPAGMSTEELDKTLNDMSKLMDNMADNSEEIGNQFGKNADEVQKDVEKAREAFKDAMKKINEGGLSKDEKQDLLDKAKDTLEDIISDDAEKEKLKKKREERDAKKESERKEKFKKNHPFRPLIVVFKNLAELQQFKLVSKDTVGILDRLIEELDPLTELHFSEMKKSQFKEISKDLDKLKESFIPDLVALIDNETILNKTEDDMKRLVDGVFEHVFNAFRSIFNDTLTEEEKGSVIKMSAQKLRIIGKVLKTQKVWKVGEDFKKGYMEEMKRLMQIRKDGGDEVLFKELFDKGVINPMALDENGQKFLKKLVGDDYFEKDGSDDYSDALMGDDEDVKPYEGKIYYNVIAPESMDTTMVELSNVDDVLDDEWENYMSFAKKFEKDFPEYILEEETEAVFSVYIKSEYSESKYVSPTVEELKKKIEENPEYEQGKWSSEE